MRFLHQTLARTSLNLALDEALLERAEHRLPADQPAQELPGAAPNHHSQRNPLSETDDQVVRLWQPTQYAVIVGRGSRVNEEVDVEFCRSRKIPIFRRHSGGATVVIGPGCWMYSAVVSLERHPELRDLSLAHRHVMTRLETAVQPFCPDVRIQGICDLTANNRKVSGNSLKVARRHFLYHGTLLVEFDLDLLSRCLLTAPRQPDYRSQRSHRDFVDNLPVPDPEAFNHGFPTEFCSAWQALSPVTNPPLEETERLAIEKYEQDEWTFRR